MRVIIVGGCGHVGLPLGIVLAQVPGVHVSLLDIAADKVALVSNGRMPFMEEGAEEALRQVIGQSLTATLDPECLREADIVITVVGTPVDAHLNPTVNQLHQSIDGLLQHMRPGALLILRSTVYPGVTKLVYDHIARTGRSVELAFCPERLAEGKAMQEITRLPQIVSAFEPGAMARARELFLKIAPSVVELNPLEAELAKLFTNSWRYLNFAISNQFYMLAQSYGLDFNRIYDAVTRDYPRMKSFARAGFAAGPCLLKDTLQLSAFAQNNFFLGHAAMLINEGLPNFIVEQLRHRIHLSDATVAILGMAFKGESDDIRESLSYKLLHLLEVHAKAVLCTDPYVQDRQLVPLEAAINGADVIIIGAPHQIYRSLSFPGKEVIDVWGIYSATAKPDIVVTPSSRRTTTGV
jgi:UDP-N-acetyl-D-mannosaminuronic acid dehydrogenase